jgi:hypothetical protein
LKISHVLGLPTAALLSAAIDEGATPATATAAPSCSKSVAKHLVVTTPFGARIKKSVGKRFFGRLPMMRIFGVAEVSCLDMTGDGQREMLVQLECCTVGSVDPWAIYTPQGDHWHLAFSRVNTNNFGTQLAVFRSTTTGVEHVAVEEKIPVYDPDNFQGNCCPNSYRYKYTIWNGTRFVYGADW